MEGLKIIPQIVNCGVYNADSINYNFTCECRTCLNKKLKRLIQNESTFTLHQLSSLLEKYSFKINILDSLLEDALYSENGSVEKIELLLREGASPNYCVSNVFGVKSILYMAIKKGRIDIIECLLRHGANPNLRLINNFTCITALGSFVANCKNTRDDMEIVVDRIVELLMEYRINIDISGINTEDAIKSLNINLIDYTINKTNYSFYRGENPYHILSRSGVNIQIQNGIDVVVPSERNVQIFNMISKSKYRDDFDKPNNEGCTPLREAVRHGNIPIVRCLLERGANPNSLVNGTSIFRSCSKIKGRDEIKALLLCYGAYVNDAEFNNTLPEVVKDFSSLGLIYCLEKSNVLNLLDATIISDIVKLDQMNSYNNEQPVLYDGRLYCRNYRTYFAEDELPFVRLTNGPPTQEQIERQIYLDEMREFVGNHFENVDRENGVIQNNEDMEQEVFDFDALLNP